MRRRMVLSTALSLALLATPMLAKAQSAIIYGSLGNFDISNDTAQVCHGFEIEIQGVTTANMLGGFSAERYGSPSVTAYAGGVRVRWESPYDASTHQFVERTLPHTVQWFPGQCYQWNPATYQNSGCEHFGTYSNANPTHVTARWLCEDSANPGVLVPYDPPTAIPMPTYFVSPPLQAGDPPQLEVEVEAPEPAEAPELYGDAQWMRVSVRQLPHEVALDDLVADNPAVVPMEPGQLETDWEIIQTEPVSHSNGNQTRGRKHGSGNIDPSTRSIVRRIEMYAFTGQYDPITHEALCADLTCSVPSNGELGDFISVQMAAANVQSNSVTVTKAGNGKVDSADKLISCGSKCGASYNEGTAVTLTAKPGSNAGFAGWIGDCSGTNLSCTVTATGEVKAYALFNAKAPVVPSCGLLGIEVLVPIAFSAVRRRRKRS